MSDAVLAEYVRDGVVESVHRGYLVALNSDGSVNLELGNIGACGVKVRATFVGTGLFKPFRF
jgi:L-asparaginase II